MTIRFTIFGEPASLKNSRQLVKLNDRPAFIKSDKARDYERSAVLQIPAEAKQMIASPVKVTITIWYASERPDLDASVILDCLQPRYNKHSVNRIMIAKGVILNDRLVREIHLYHQIDKQNPRAEIQIELLSETKA